MRPEKSYETPAQDKLKKEIAALNANIVTKRQMRDSGLSDVSTAEIAKMHKEVKQKEKDLKRKQNNAIYSKDKRYRTCLK